MDCRLQSAVWTICRIAKGLLKKKVYFAFDRFVLTCAASGGSAAHEFSSDSVKHESKTQNEDFSFDLKTPRGHFFAVIDFDSHDFANLNATLKGKLETIVNSFVSLSRFSADLFLGFLAKEINNFLHNLREQAGGPQLIGNGVFCLLSGNRLELSIVRKHRNTYLEFREANHIGPSRRENGLQKLGGSFQESPLTDAVQSSTLDDEDVDW